MQFFNNQIFIPNWSKRFLHELMIKQLCNQQWWIEILYAINNFTIRYSKTMKVIEFASTYDKVKYTISNEGLRYAILNDLIK